VITEPADGSTTTDSTPPITGTAEPGAVVTVIDQDGTELGTTTADAGGDWTFDSVELADGPYTATATATDEAGNASVSSEPVDFVVDATTDTPVITAPVDGSSTDDTTPTISGTAEPGATVTVSVDGTDVGSPIADADGNWTVDVTDPLAEGDHTVTAVAVDESGNESEPATPVDFVVDTTAPDAPVITEPVDGSTTADSTPTISGTAEPSTTVTVTDADGTELGTATTDPDGDWTFASVVLEDGTYTITAVAVDEAGNDSDGSEPVTFTVDTTAPDVPVITEPADGSTTADSTPTISGTAEPGSTVTVTDAEGTELGTATTNPQGDWTFASVELEDGTYTITAVASDEAGNDSDGSEPVTFTVDTEVPAAPVITGPDDGSTITDTTPTITGTGEPGATVEVSIDGTVVGTAPVNTNGVWTIDSPDALAPGDHEASATQTDPAGNVSVADSVGFTIDQTASPSAPVIEQPTSGSTTADPTPVIAGTGVPGATVTVTDQDDTELGTAVVGDDGSWALTSIPLDDGTYTITAVQAVEDGDDSPESNSVIFTVETEGDGDPALPPAPVITAPEDGSVTDDSTPTISGTGEPGNTVTVTDEEGAVLGSAEVDPDGSWQVVAPELPDGDHTITATQTDADGNTSEESAPVDFTIDTDTPDAPVITDPDDQSLTNDNTPTISGTGEPGATITVSIDGDDAGTTVVEPDGSWNFTFPDPIGDGDHAVGATQTDGAGNASEADQITITVDTAVDAPTISTPEDGSTITDTTPEITGTGEPGATVIVVIDDEIVGEVPVDDDGNWSFTPDQDLDLGDHTISVTQTDDAGNVSDPAEVQITVTDGEAPPPPTITSPDDGEAVGDRTPTVTGTGQPGASVGLIIDGDQTLTSTVGDDGSWSVTVPDPLSCGQHTIVAVQTDVETLSTASLSTLATTSEPSDPVTFEIVCGDDGDGDGGGVGQDGDLPDTGVPAGLMAIALIGALALAGGLLLVRRRLI
jgi:LPXTG-motif cell wall-anchored protein